MPRVIFLPNSRNNYFSVLKKLSGLSWKLLSKQLKVSDRQFRDWRNGKATFPEQIASTLKDKYGLCLPSDVVCKEDYWYITKAASLGGKRHFELYGSPGTLNGRRKGGLNSLKTHVANKTGFILRKEINKPKRSERLAEIIGVLMGDGGITTRQVQVSLNLKTDKLYANYLRKVMGEIFAVKVSLYERIQNSTIEVVASSTNLVAFLERCGLPIGNKIRQKLDIPFWIYQRESWQRACLRGLFDTDGCTYIDHHIYKNKVYAHICIAFTSRSEKLLESIQASLKKLGYSPTLNSGQNILLRKEQEVLRFFQDIRPANSRHYDKLNEFLEEYRSGYNGIVSKAIV